MGVALQKVECGACRRCCVGQTIVLHPEAGDDPKQFVTRPGHHPVHGAPAYIIPNKPNGECHYLGEDGCQIWGKHPVMCRHYRCDEDFLKFKALSRPDRRRRIKAGTLDMKMLERGRELVEAEETQ